MFNKKNIDEIHKKDLGFETPENYFSNVEKEILSKISAQNKPKVIPFYRKKIVWFAAASIAFVIALTIYKQQIATSIKTVPQIVLDTLNLDENLNLASDYIFEEDVLVASLFINDNNIENFVNNAFIKSVASDENLDDYIVDNLMNEDLF